MSPSCASFLVLSLFVASLASVHACFSEGRRQELMVDYERRGRELGMKDANIKCLLKAGDSFAPDEFEVHGQTISCFHDGKYADHMVGAMSDCVDNMKPVERSLKVDGKLMDNVDASVKPVIVRRPVEPNNVLRRAARFFGLKETVRSTCRASCLSGCHRCCVNTGIGGDDRCFLVYCGGYGYCW